MLFQISLTPLCGSTAFSVLVHLCNASLATPPFVFKMTATVVRVGFYRRAGSLVSIICTVLCHPSVRQARLRFKCFQDKILPILAKIWFTARFSRSLVKRWGTRETRGELWALRMRRLTRRLIIAGCKAWHSTRSWIRSGQRARSVLFGTSRT